MKAVMVRAYGTPDVLKIEDIEKPSPKADEVLVKVYASSVNPAEFYSMSGMPIARLMGGGLWRPKDARMGVDYAGVVEAVGAQVSGIQPGDEVFGARSGAFAEYVCARNFVFAKPANISFEEAGSAATAAITAVQGLRQYGKLQPGQKVLINGASGGVGTFAVQIARALGAEVTAVCSTPNVELVRKLGAAHVIDYTKEDFTRCGKKFDLLLDIAGNRNWGEIKRVLQPNARYIIIGAPKSNGLLGPLGAILKLRLSALGASQTVAFFIAQFNREDFLLLKELFESGQVKPLVEKVYPLEQIAAAMRHLGTGHAHGKIVVSMKK